MVDLRELIKLDATYLRRLTESIRLSMTEAELRGIHVISQLVTNFLSNELMTFV